MPGPSWLPVLVAAAAGALLMSLLWRASRALDRWRMRRRFSRGRAGQKKARKWLCARGFEVLAEEAPIPAAVEVDGERLPYELRIDFVVSKGRRVYGVEVKTGSRAPDPSHRETRRQLLEYSAHLGLDGLFLLDMDTPQLMQIRFPGLRQPRGAAGWLRALLWGVALGAALGAAAARLAG